MTPEGSWFCISACSNAIRHHLAGTPSAALCWVIEPVGTLELQGLRALAALSLLQSWALQSWNTAVQHWEPLKPWKTRQAFRWNTQDLSIYYNAAKIKPLYKSAQFLHTNTASSPISNPLTPELSQAIYVERPATHLQGTHHCKNQTEALLTLFVCLQKNLQWLCIYIYTSVLGVFQKRSRTGYARKY